MKIKLYTGSITPSDGITRDVLVMVFKDTNTMQLFDQDSVHKSWESFCSAEGIDDVDEMAETLLDMLMWVLNKDNKDGFDSSEFPTAKLSVFDNLGLVIEADLQKASDEEEAPKVLH